MSAWECRGCTAVYAVDAPRCPQCGVNDPIDEVEQLRRENEMPKITVHGGPSNADTTVHTDESQDGDVAQVDEENQADTVEDTGDADGDETAEAVDYNAFTVEELRAELKDRELATSGNKPELVERLAADDEAHADEAENVSAQAGVAAGTGEAGASA